MLNLDDIFEFEKDQSDHPKLRYWKALAAKHDQRPVVEVVRPRDGLGFAPARMRVILLDEQGARVKSKSAKNSEPWDAQLALATVELGWRALDDESEMIRFGLLFKVFFSQAEMRYGDGFFSSVLVHALRAGSIGRQKPVAEVLRFISVPPPATSLAKKECEEIIKSVLAKVARLLVKRVDYSSKHAKEIIALSLAYFLDERFSITPGKLLGLYASKRAG